MNKVRSLSVLLTAFALSLTAQEGRKASLSQDPEAIPFVRMALENPQDDARVQWPPLGRGGRPITDNARLRAEAMRQWWGEWTPGFRRFMLETAGKVRHQEEGSFQGKSGIEAALVAPAQGTWLNIGPTKADVIKNGSTSLAKTDSGRPRSIVIDPANAQVIYLCTSGGGVWKTTNGGTSWAPITDHLGSLSNGFLAMDPSNSQVLYLGLGDPFDGTGIGLVKSTDGGATWGGVVTLGASKSIRSIAVHPTNPNIVMASTNAGLFRSTDAGATFAAVASIPTTYEGWDLAHAGANTFVLSAETDPANTESAGKVFRSTDDGATWVATAGIGATATRISVASAPSNRSILYAMASNSANNLLAAYKSTDGGANWSAISSTGITDILGGQGFYNHMILVDRSNPDTVYFGGQLYVAKSTTGGSSWTKISDWLAQNSLPYVHADMHAAAQDSAGNIYVGSDGGIFKSTNGGTTWTDTLNIGITSHLIYALGTSPVTPDAVIGGFQDNGTRVRKTNTTTYDQQLGGDGFGCVMHQSTSGTMLGSLYYTRIYKSTDSGTTFTSASSGITESNNSSSAPFITRIALGPADSTGNTVYTFVNAKPYKSTNFAGSWTAMGVSGLPTTSFVIRNIAAAKSNASVVGLAASAGRVFLTANGGSTWTQAAAPPNNGSFMSSVAFDPTDYNTVYTTSVAPDATKSHIWKSSNFGGAWAAIDTNGLPAGIPVNLVVVDPSDRNVLYAGTHLGLYRSADAGTSWSRWGTGLPLVNVMDIAVTPSTGKVRVATYGRGFWELQGTAAPTAPSITSQPQSVSVATGSTATFSVTASGTAPLSYQWYKNSAAVSGATSASHTTPATTSADNGATFYAVVTNSVGSATSTSATLTVTSPTAPSITGQPQNATVNAGATATFSVTASGTAPLTYQWRKNGTNISGATAASYTTPATTTADNGATFSVVVSNSAGSATSNNATLTVNTPPPPATYTEVEANNTIATANTVSDATTKITGYIGSSTDADYFKLNLGAGKTLTVAMTGPTGSTYDYDLYFYNAAGTQLASGTGATTTENVSWKNTGTASTVVYVAVKRYLGSSTTLPYTLTLTR